MKKRELLKKLENKNFWNNQNYYKNILEEKKYLADKASRKIANGIELMIFLILDLIANIVFIYYSFLDYIYNTEDIMNLFIILLVWIAVINYMFIVVITVWIKKIFTKRLVNAYRILLTTSSSKIWFYISIWVTFILISLKYFFLYWEDFMIISIIVSSFVTILLFLISLLDMVKREQGLFELTIDLFFILIFWSLFFIKLIIRYIAQLLLFIFFPIIKKRIFKKRFYSLVIGGKGIFEIWKDIFITK